MHGRIALRSSVPRPFGMLLVNVTDPYAGATASPYYQTSATPHLSARAKQSSMSRPPRTERADTRDSFTVTEKPKPPPPPPPAPAAPAPAAKASGGGSSAKASAPVAVASPGSAQAIASDMVAGPRLGHEQYDCLVALWNRESGWRVNASNGSSGAYGIPQALPGSKMASVGADWETNPATQITWGLGYIAGATAPPAAPGQHSVDTAGTELPRARRIRANLDW